MATQLGEFETELEDELAGLGETHEVHEAHELEEELESEEFLRTLGNIAGSLLGEEEVHEGALEHGEVHEGLGEYENEDFLRTIGNIAGSLLGEEEIHEGVGELGEIHEAHELGEIHEGVGELGEIHEAHELGEYESEEFFRRAFRGIRGFVRRAAPILRRVARVAAPIVGTAVGGPLGGMLGRYASTLFESELAHEMQETLEMQESTEMESAMEAEFEAEAAAPLTSQEAVAEMMAAVASGAATEAEAEAMAGASTVTIIRPADRAALRRILPHLVRGTAILTRILRQRRITRPAVRAVPTIVRRTTRILGRRIAAGQPVTRRTAARVMANQTRRVLGNPRLCARAIAHNVRGTRAVARVRPRVRRPRVSREAI